MKYKTKWPQAHAPGPVRNETGMALMTSVFLLLVLGLLVTFSSQWSAMDIKRTGDYRKTRAAFYVAEAGLQDAINHLNYDADGNSPGAAKNNFQTALNGNWPTAFINGVPYNGETYTVTVQDNLNDDAANDMTVDTDQTIIAKATGTFKGHTATIEAVLHRPRYWAEGAVVTEESVTAVGSGSVTGAYATIHSNDTVTLGGSVTISGGATGVNGCNDGGTSNTCNSDPDFYQDLPVFEPSDFKKYADYVFRSDGMIYKPSTGQYYRKNGSDWKVDNNPATPAGPWGPVEPELAAFSFHGNGLNDGWQVPGSNTPYDAGTGTGDLPNNKFLYFEESFIANGATGAPGDSWVTTIVSEKDLNFGGSAYIENCETCGPDKGVQKLFLVAGDDIKSNTFILDITGIIVAKEHLWLGGNAQLEGYVQANNIIGAQASSLVTENKLAGGFSVKYDAKLPGPVPEKKVRVLTWREE